MTVLKDYILLNKNAYIWKKAGWISAVFFPASFFFQVSRLFLKKAGWKENMINIQIDQMSLCEKIRSKCLNLQRITSIFNKNQRDCLGSKSVTFLTLISPNFDHRGMTRVSKSIIFSVKTMDIIFVNTLHFLWREASQNSKVGNYENFC